MPDDFGDSPVPSETQLNVTLRHLLGVAISSLTTPCASTAFGQHARPTYNLGQCDGLASFQVPVPPQLRPREVYGDVLLLR